jgi:hypothetical protein
MRISSSMACCRWHLGNLRWQAGLLKVIGAFSIGVQQALKLFVLPFAQQVYWVAPKALPVFKAGGAAVGCPTLFAALKPVAVDVKGKVPAFDMDLPGLAVSPVQSADLHDPQAKGNVFKQLVHLSCRESRGLSHQKRPSN